MLDIISLEIVSRVVKSFFFNEEVIVSSLGVNDKVELVDNFSFISFPTTGAQEPFPIIVKVRFDKFILIISSKYESIDGKIVILYVGAIKTILDTLNDSLTSVAILVLDVSYTFSCFIPFSDNLFAKILATSLLSPYIEAKRIITFLSSGV